MTLIACTQAALVVGLSQSMVEFLELWFDNVSKRRLQATRQNEIDPPDPMEDHMKALDPEVIALGIAQRNPSLEHVAVTLYAGGGPGFLWEVERNEGHSRTVSLLRLGPYTDEKSRFWKAPEERL